MTNPSSFPPFSPDQLSDLLAGRDNPLAPYYQRFAVESRILLTGHSHQAWPDCAEQGVLEAFADAARHVDDKWALAEAKAEQVRAGFARRLDDPDGGYVLGQNVHELGLRWLSALPSYCDGAGLSQKRPILTTDQEFHSLRRQLDRLSEYGIAIHKEPMARDICTRLAERVAAKPGEGFGAVVVSAVSYKEGLHIAGLGELARACAAADTPLLIDAYHAVNVLPLSVRQEGIATAFITGGGYKYGQLGEGNCFLRLPAGHSGRPGITGWFADVPNLATAASGGATQVAYPEGIGSYAGSTYDPTSHYRAARVMKFFDDSGLTVEVLRKISQRQMARLCAGIESLRLPEEQVRLHKEEGPIAVSERAGFLALTIKDAGTWAEALRRHNVYCDARESTLRFGPAPYVSDAQLDAAVAALGAVASQMASHSQSHSQ